MVRLQVRVLESLLDGDTPARGERETPAHEVERVGLGLGAHFAQVAPAVEGERTEVVSAMLSAKKEEKRGRNDVL